MTPYGFKSFPYAGFSVSSECPFFPVQVGFDEVDPTKAKVTFNQGYVFLYNGLESVTDIPYIRVYGMDEVWTVKDKDVFYVKIDTVVYNESTPEEPSQETESGAPSEESAPTADPSDGDRIVTFAELIVVNSDSPLPIQEEGKIFYIKVCVFGEKGKVKEIFLRENIHWMVDSLPRGNQGEMLYWEEDEVLNTGKWVKLRAPLIAETGKRNTLQFNDTKIIPKWEQVHRFLDGEQGDMLYWQTDAIDPQKGEWVLLKAPVKDESESTNIKLDVLRFNHDNKIPDWEKELPMIDGEQGDMLYWQTDANDPLKGEWVLLKAPAQPDFPHLNLISFDHELNRTPIWITTGNESPPISDIFIKGKNKGEMLYWTQDENGANGKWVLLSTPVFAAETGEKNILIFNDDISTPEWQTGKINEFLEEAQQGDMLYWEDNPVKGGPKWVRLSAPAPASEGETNILTFNDIDVIPEWEAKEDIPEGLSGGEEHPWKVTLTAVNQYSTAGGTVFDHNSGLTIVVPTTVINFAGGYIYLKVTRNASSRAITAAEIISSLVEIEESVELNQYFKLAYIDPFEVINQYQFQEIKVFEMLIVANGEFKLGNFQMMGYNNYDLPT